MKVSEIQDSEFIIKCLANYLAFEIFLPMPAPDFCSVSAEEIQRYQIAKTFGCKKQY